MKASKSPAIVALALVFTLATLAAGYLAFGALTTFVFTSGFLGGFVLWLALPTRAQWADIRLPYWLALALFVAHRIEENRTGFFARLSQITGEATPEILSPALIILLVLSVGAWLAIPYLFHRGAALGAYFAWTFFAAMGFTELAHFVVFPLIDGEPWGYFPGMATVVLLAPLAWFGMARLVNGHDDKTNEGAK